MQLFGLAILHACADKDSPEHAYLYMMPMRMMTTTMMMTRGMVAMRTIGRIPGEGGGGRVMH